MMGAFPDDLVLDHLVHAVLKNVATVVVHVTMFDQEAMVTLDAFLAMREC